METTHHGEDASPDNPPRQQKSGNTDEQTIALTKARLAIDEVDARIVELLKNAPNGCMKSAALKRKKFPYLRSRTGNGPAQQIEPPECGRAAGSLPPGYLP